MEVARLKEELKMAAAFEVLKAELKAEQESGAWVKKKEEKKKEEKKKRSVNSNASVEGLNGLRFDVAEC